MLDSVAAFFGMSPDDIVKIIGALGVAISTALGAYTKMLLTLRGARKRSFVKIRRLEDIALEIGRETDFKSEALGRLLKEMKEDQRDHADEKDAT